MAKSIVVTAAESGYFPLLKDWVESILSFPELAGLETCVLDIGLEASQREWLARTKTRTLHPAWDIDIEQRPDRPHYYKAMTVRPYLPKYFAGYDIIAWFDSDIWVQEPAALLLYLAAAERYGFAITPEIDRSYSFHYGKYSNLRSLHHHAYYQCFGREAADHLIDFPILNSGAFALRRDHPIWGEWQKACRQAMQNAALKHSEQAALNLAIYNALPPAHRPHLLPSRANWICALSLPAWDPGRQKLVEPHLPHDALGLIHLTSFVKPINIATVGGPPIAATITFSGIRALRAGMPAR